MDGAVRFQWPSPTPIKSIVASLCRQNPLKLSVCWRTNLVSFDCLLFLSLFRYQLQMYVDTERVLKSNIRRQHDLIRKQRITVRKSLHHTSWNSWNQPEIVEKQIKCYQSKVTQLLQKTTEYNHEKCPTTANNNWSNTLWKSTKHILTNITNKNEYYKQKRKKRYLQQIRLDVWKITTVVINISHDKIAKSSIA